MNSKRSCTVFLTCCLLLSLAACGLKESSSESKNSTQESIKDFTKNEEESQDPDPWKEPEIFYCRVPDNLEPGQKIDQAIHQLCRMVLESRTGTEETADEKIEKYGYCMKGYWNYGVVRVVASDSETYKTDEETRELDIQADGRTWVVAYDAAGSYWGIPERSPFQKPSIPYEGPEPPAFDPEIHKGGWPFYDWWIVHQEEDTLFSMMCYGDYQKVKEHREEYSENPFEAYPVRAEDIPESEYWKYDIWDYIVCSGLRSATMYYEPLHAYLYETCLIYEYEADINEDSEAALQKAALELGRMYLEELCSREYDPWMTGKYTRGATKYYVKDYKDLRVECLMSSLDYAEAGEYFTVTPAWKPHQPQIMAADNIWIAEYQFIVECTNGLITQPNDGFSPGDRAVIIKDGNRYSMVLSADISEE